MAAKKTAKKTAEPASKNIPAPAKPAVKKAVETAKKAPVKKAATKKIAVKKAKPTKAELAAKPSLDTIARAAYLNYRRRVENGLPGDSHGDWLEAERFFSSPRS